MRLFININDIDVYYAKPQTNGNIEVKISKFNVETKENMTANFLLPDVVLIANNGFDENSINYMAGILNSCKEHIKNDALKFSEDSFEPTKRQERETGFYHEEL